MAQSGKAPRALAYVNKRGVPVFAILLTNAVGSISMMNVSTGAARAYGYIVNLSGVSTFLVWASIAFIHIRFRRGWAVQGRSVTELPYKAMGYPWMAYFGVFANIFLALIQGWTTLSPFNAGNFVVAYILFPLFGIIYVVCKIYWRKTDKFQRSHEMDLDSGRRMDLDNKGIVPEDEPEVQQQQQTSWWRNTWNKL